MSLVWTEWLNVGGDRSWGSCRKTETQGRRCKTPPDCVSCYRRPLPSRAPLCPEQKHYTVQLLDCHSEPGSIGIVSNLSRDWIWTSLLVLLLLSLVRYKKKKEEKSSIIDRRPAPKSKNDRACLIQAAVGAWAQGEFFFTIIEVSFLPLLPSRWISAGDPIMQHFSTEFTRNPWLKRRQKGVSQPGHWLCYNRNLDISETFLVYAASQALGMIAAQPS